jgi:hypothetical protein
LTAWCGVAAVVSDGVYPGREGLAGSVSHPRACVSLTAVAFDETIYRS